MTGIIDRIQSAIGSDYAKIAEFTHHTFHDRMSTHGHFGRAAVETAAEVCRRHPAVFGLGVGLLVDRLLVEEARHHDARLQAAADAPAAAAAEPEAKPQPKARKGKAALPHVRVTKLKPGRIALEVFGGLLLLKMAASGAKIFRHKHQEEIWFSPAAKMHLFSATFCAYNLTKALSAKKVSAWRNGAILFFGTDAIKPVLKWYRTHPLSAQVGAPAAEPAAEAAPAPAVAAPAAVPAPVPFPHAEPADATLAAVAHLQAHPYAMPQAQPMPEPQPANLHTLYS